MSKKNTTNKWFDKSRRGYLLDFQIPDSFDQVPLGQLPVLSDIDPERIVYLLKDAGVTALYTHARDYPGNCYYDTKVGHKHTGIGDRDLLREFSQACRKADMTILYYVYLAQAHEPRGSYHAEKDFRRVDPDGKPTPDRFICMNSPGREYIKALLGELSENYDFDGYWLDSFTWAQGMPLCYCDTCKAKFLEEMRLELPDPDDFSSHKWRSYIKWIRRHNSLVVREINQVIRNANSDLTIAYNGSHRFRGPFTSAEHNDDDDYLSSEFHHDGGIGMLSYDCLRNAALSQESVFEIELWRFFIRHDRKMRRANQVRPLAQLFTEMSTVIAHGGMIQYYDQIKMDGTVDMRSIEVLKGAFAEIQKRESFLEPNQLRVPYAFIVWAKESEGLISPPPWDEQKKGVRGFHSALLEKAIPHTILSDIALRDGQFKDAKVVILPCMTCLGEEKAEHLRNYVRSGGGLVATYRTSLQDDSGNPRDNFGLADLFGADYLELLSYKYGSMKFHEPHAITEGLPLDWPMSIFDQWQTKVAPQDTAKGMGNIAHPFRGWQLGFLPGEDTPYPAVVTHIYGKGRVVYFPQPLGRCYNEYGHPDTQRLLVNAVRWAAGEAPPIEVTCTDTVEFVMWQTPNGDKRMIHLINRTGCGREPSGCAVLQEAIPIHDINIRLRSSIQTAVLQPDNQELSIERINGWTEISIPRLETYSIVIAKS